MNTLKISLLCLMAVSLTGCFFHNDKDDPVNKLNGLSNASADGEPSQIIDPGALQGDIAKLFGNPDDNPLDLEMGDTIQMITDRNKRIDS